MATYILDRAGGFFPGWTREAIEDYVDFHLGQGTMVLAIDQDGYLAGLICGWQQDKPTHEKWHWQKTDPAGRFWWWDHFIADEPEIAASLAAAYIELWPLSNLLPGAAMRNGRQRTYKPGQALEVFRKAVRFYGLDC